MTRVAVIGSPEKESAPAVMQRACAWLSQRAEVVFAELTYEAGRALPFDPDLLIVLGGDGTLIAVVNHLAERQVPIGGVNLGKLGFLAEFTIDELEHNGDFLFRGQPPVTRRIMLDVRMERPDGGVLRRHAVNDCVVLAGPPYRMIELHVAARGDEVAELRGDGLTVGTGWASTAHNLSAGGPILEPTAEVMLLTPICAHALTFRPLALDARREIVVRGRRVNEGTTVIVDGQVWTGIGEADRLIVRRYAADFLLVRNPARPTWHALRRKLMWGENPGSRA